MKCLCCYKNLLPGQKDYHPSCAKRMFGSAEVPELPYEHSQIRQLAKSVIRTQTTVPGVQAKLSMDIQRIEHTTRFTIVGLQGRYILKPQTEQYAELPEIEDLTMHLAEQAGIAVVPHCLARFADNRLVYLSTRIDRTNKGEKIAMEDLCQLSEQLTEYKYRGSYEQVSKVIHRLSSAPMLDVVNFWQIVLFSWLTGNSDMHLKNFSLYAPKGHHILSPAYDLVNTLIVLPSDPEELALNLNGKKRKINWCDFQQAMTVSGVPEKVQDNMRKQFVKVLPQWEKTIQSSFLSEEMKEKYLAMVHLRFASF
ncbi:MAG: HipA domain-containing protein [Paludibacteraceae bacterium]|nr:HipA domain-containing protein [Paludibacteraceae bacterium]